MSLLVGGLARSKCRLMLALHYKKERAPRSPLQPQGPLSVPPILCFPCSASSSGPLPMLFPLFLSHPNSSCLVSTIPVPSIILYFVQEDSSHSKLATCSFLELHMHPGLIPAMAPVTCHLYYHLLTEL